MSQCATCETIQKKFYCVDCLSGHLHHFRSATERAEGERDAAIATATTSLASVDQRRLYKAQVYGLEDSIAEMRRWTIAGQRHIEDLRTRLIRQRENLRRRRANIHAAFEIHGADRDAQQPHSDPPSIADLVHSQKQALIATHAALARSRRLLIRELVQVFDVGESRPSSPPASPSRASNVVNTAFGMGSVFGTIRRTGLLSPLAHSSYHPTLPNPAPNVPSPSNETPFYAISSLTLPSNPAKLYLLPTEHIHAAIGMTISFLRLLSFYLGVRLPFEIIWDGTRPGVGNPWIKAIPGDDEGGWAKYPAPQPLFPPPPPSEDTSLVQQQQQEPYHPLPPIISTLVMSAGSSATTSARLVPSMTTALAMITYDVLYLLHTQKIIVPSTPVSPDPLRLLTTLCFASNPEVGLYAHSSIRPPYRLPPPTRGFSARSFGDVLRALHSIAGSGGQGAYLSRARRHREGPGEDAEWDLVERDEEDDDDDRSRTTG